MLNEYDDDDGVVDTASDRCSTYIGGTIISIVKVLQRSGLPTVSDIRCHLHMSLFGYVARFDSGVPANTALHLMVNNHKVRKHRLQSGLRDDDDDDSSRKFLSLSCEVLAISSFYIRNFRVAVQMCVNNVPKVVR